MSIGALFLPERSYVTGRQSRALIATYLLVLHREADAPAMGPINHLEGERVHPSRVNASHRLTLCTIVIYYY